LTSLDETIEKIALPDRESLEEVQFQAEEALEIREEGETEEEPTIKNLKDIDNLDDDSQNLGEDGYPTPPLSEHLVQFLENETIALPVKNPAPSQHLSTSQGDQDLIDEIEPAFLHEI
jgi:hypothetical protein